MADVKITGLPAGTLDTGDLVEFVDLTDGISKKGEWINIPIKIVFSKTLSNPDTAITLPSIPTTPSAVTAFRNGQEIQFNVDFTIAGDQFTLTAAPFGVDQRISGIYNDEASGPSVTSVFGRPGPVITAQAGDYTVAQITGAAASGVNSDITSLTGLTTALSIAQGGTNSTAALANGKVMASVGGEIVESAIDTSDVGPKSILTFGANGVSATTVTRYLWGYFANATAPTSIINIVMPYSGTLKNLHIYHNSTAGNGNDIVYTVTKNGTPDTLTVTIASTLTTDSDLINTVSVSAGDTIAVEVTKAVSIGSSPSDIYATMELS